MVLFLPSETLTHKKQTYSYKVLFLPSETQKHIKTSVGFLVIAVLAWEICAPGKEKPFEWTQVFLSCEGYSIFKA